MIDPLKQTQIGITKRRRAEKLDQPHDLNLSDAQDQEAQSAELRPHHETQASG